MASDRPAVLKMRPTPADDAIAAIINLRLGEMSRAFHALYGPAAEPDWRENADGSWTLVPKEKPHA